jgi:Protein of unknown function (DUF998)
MSRPSSIRPLAWLGLSGCVVFTVAVIALHVIQPELSPLRDAVSYYVHGSCGWLTTLGLIALGIGSLAITIAVARSVLGPYRQFGSAALAVWSLGALVAGVFPADPTGNWDQPPSTAGAIHGLAAVIAIVAFPLAAVALTRSVSRDHRLQSMQGVSRAVAAVVVMSFLAFMASLFPVFVTPGPPFMLGLTERVMLAAYVAWLAVVAIGLLRSLRIQR